MHLDVFFFVLFFFTVSQWNNNHSTCTVLCSRLEHGTNVRKENQNHSCGGLNLFNIYGASVSKHRRSRVQTDSAAASVVGVLRTPPSALRIAPQHKCVSWNIPQIGSNLFLLYPPPYVVCAFVCRGPARSQLLERGQCHADVHSPPGYCASHTTRSKLSTRSKPSPDSKHTRTCSHWSTREHTHWLFFPFTSLFLTWSFSRTDE